MHLIILLEITIMSFFNYSVTLGNFKNILYQSTVRELIPEGCYTFEYIKCSFKYDRTCDSLTLFLELKPRKQDMMKTDDFHMNVDLNGLQRTATIVKSDCATRLAAIANIDGFSKVSEKFTNDGHQRLEITWRQVMKIQPIQRQVVRPSLLNVRLKHQSHN